MPFYGSSISASSLPSRISNPIIPFLHTSTKNITQFFCVNVASSCGNENMGSGIEYEGRDYNAKPVEPILNSGSEIKAPTPPWMNEPLLVKSNEILKFRKPGNKKDSTFVRNGERLDLGLTGKVGGGRGKVAMKKILESIENLRETEDLEEISETPENLKFKFAPGALWGDRDYETEAGVLENYEERQESLDVLAFDFPISEFEKEDRLKSMPWEKDERMVDWRMKKEKAVSAAELSLDEMLLERLRTEAVMMRVWVKVKKAGVTQAVVDQVYLAWGKSELALLKFDLPLCRNMDRAREIVELKTGGLVVWTDKDFLAVYRGCNYLSCPKHLPKTHPKSSGGDIDSVFKVNGQNTLTISPESSYKSGQEETINGETCKWDNLHMLSLYEREADRLLDGLGPRFVDWWMQKPLPVDADLLPEVIPGFKTPSRLRPPGTRSKLTDAELTYLRKLARPLPTHFVLGRNRKLQGLASAILKLWEKCHIAKIALKWGIPNTDNEQMANELKSLTGGVLILRNKFLIILYRGKDFVPSNVANLVAERETEITRYQLEEEAARLKASETFSITSEQLLGSDSIGTLLEFHSFQTEMTNVKKEKSEVELQMGAEQERLEKDLKDQERKLFILKKKIEQSTKILEKLQSASKCSEQDVDQEIISQEERVCLREMGLKMVSSLVLGRRGIYDGVIEGMHQHWKHREVVKVITMQKKFSQVMHCAKSLEAESGGILISVVKLKEGHAIIIYRGKNYKRPNSAAQNLLNKREALSRSLEIQRLGSLKFFANQREQSICDLRLKLAEFSEKKIDDLSCCPIQQLMK